MPACPYQGFASQQGLAHSLGPHLLTRDKGAWPTLGLGPTRSTSGDYTPRPLLHWQGLAFQQGLANTLGPSLYTKLGA